VKLWSFGGHVDGPVAVLGYLLPPGGAHDARQKVVRQVLEEVEEWLWSTQKVVRQVLEDLKAVAVDYLGGMVVGPAAGPRSASPHRLALFEPGQSDGKLPNSTPLRAAHRSPRALLARTWKHITYGAKDE
jgi:hypothetical protein